MADDIQQKIAEALDAGHSMSAIAEHLANHENPDYQAYGKSWIESKNAFSTRKSDFQDDKKSLAGSITPMLDLANENPNATLGLLGGVAALYTGYKVKNALEDRRIRRETHESEMEKNKAYVRQVELQAKNVEGTPQPTAKELAQSVKQAEGVTPQTKPNPLNAYAEQKYGVPLATLEEVSGGPIKSIADVDVVGGTVSKGGNITINTKPGAFTQPSGYAQTTPVVPQPPQSQFDLNQLGKSQDPLAGRGWQQPVIPADVISTGPTSESAEAPIKEAEKIKKVVEPPPSGMRTQYTKKKGEIGPGGYNWFASQVGHEEAPARWEEQYGKKNVPYKQVEADYQATRYPPSPKTVEGKSGGAFGKPEYIPEHIRGSSNLKNLAGLAGVSGLLMAASSPESQAAMARASEAIKDIGISPEAILRGKGDELGRMGNAYVTAGNPSYLRELKSQLDVETNPERRAILLREFQKIGGSGAGRGIAPPSAYLR